MEDKRRNAISIVCVLERMKRIYSCKYGLADCLSFNEEKEHARIKSSTECFVIGSTIPMYRTYVDSTNASFSEGGGGAGAAITKEKSQVKAFGEFIERFCGSNIVGNHEIHIEYNTYGNQSKYGDCLDLFELIDFDDNSYKCNDPRLCKYTYDSMVSWVKGVEITGKKDTWIPAQKAFIGIPLLHGELPYLQWISTGLACGSSYPGALIGGIYEVVERDSFMLTWQLRLHGKRIVVDQIMDPELEKLYNHINNYLVGEDNLLIYDISRTDGIYTILTFIKNDNPNSFGLITSAASDIDPERALLKSLEELCLTQSFGYSMLLHSQEGSNGIRIMEKADVTDLHKHLLYYGTGRNSHAFDFIEDVSSSINLSDMFRYADGLDERATLGYICDLFKRQNKPIYAVDVTRCEIMDCGLHVLRAIIPGYNDLEVSHNMRLLKNKRLKEFRDRYKCALNDEPHPFP